MYKLRDYQETGREDILKFLNSTEQKGVLVSPTGTGKSLYTGIFSELVNDKVLVVQHSKELLEQNYDKAVALGLTPTIYSASFKSKEVSNLTFATIQSVFKKPEDFKDFDYICWDECHLNSTRQVKRGKVIKTSLFEKFLDEISPKKILGLTATPLIMDNIPESALSIITNTKSNYFYNSSFINITQIYNIRDKWWSNIRYVKYNSSYDKTILELNSTGSDFTKESILKAYENNLSDDKIINLVQKIIKKGQVKHILIFVPSIEHAESIEKSSNGLIKSIHSNTNKKERQKILSDFKNGIIKAIVNIDVLSVGFDFPELDCIIMARDTGSFGIYYQIVGRLVRLHEKKEKAYFIDMCSNVDRMGNVENLNFSTEPSNKRIEAFNGQKLLTNFPLKMIEDAPTFQELKEYSEKKLFTIKNVKMTFGKYKGQRLLHVIKKDPRYIEWIYTSDDFNFKYIKNQTEFRNAIKNYYINKLKNE